VSELLTINCPHCAYSKEIPVGSIPETARQATCPKCKQAFPLNSTTLRSGVAEPAATSEPPPPIPPPLDSASALAAAPVVPAVVPAAPVPPRPAPRTLNFIFHGTARDYFGIWIVNTLLKIMSAGIYSAWAKVRQRRFFYGSTTLHDQPFEYLADPMAIFKGWLIAAGAFILYSIATQVSPTLSGVIALLIFAVFPWLLVRSRIFNAVNSSYRNIRFGFRPNYREAYVVFFGLTLLSIVTFGLLLPYMLYRQRKFMVENSSYGSIPFSFNATVKDFYMLTLKVALVAFVVFGALGLILSLAGGGQLLSASTVKGKEAFNGLMLIPFLMFPLVYFILVVYIQTALANLSWNGTRVGNSSFLSTLRTRDMIGLFVTNALAVLFSLGLLMPWATVRMVRYRFEHLQLDVSDGLENVLAAAGNSAVGAAGDEFGDVFDMPMDIGL